MANTALAAKPETKLGARHGDMARPHRREPDRSVLAGIFLVADADERFLQERYHGGEDLVPPEPRPCQIAADATAQPGQREAEGDDAMELGRVAHLRPALVIPVLFAAPRVTPG